MNNKLNDSVSLTIELSHFYYFIFDPANFIILYWLFWL